MFLPLLFMLMICEAKSNEWQRNRPNIVFMIADDLGWDDVSFHGSDQIPTPNIDLLAFTGVPLERYYSHSICTPSRSALLTGKYSHVLGMQGYPLTNSEDRGLPLKEKILPQYFKELGYTTHLIGKWHVGQSRKDFLPTMRGFDTHYGNRGGFLDYYEYVLQETEDGVEYSGLDLFRNMSAAWSEEGYITDLYTQEAKAIIESHNKSVPLFLLVAHNAPHSGNDGAVLQAPPEDVRSMRHVESPQRRIFAGMMKKLDESVGEIVKALLDKGILNDTIIVFVSDNGGMTSGATMNYASNWPLRGLKMTPFEGGVRVTGLIWTQNLTDFSHSWKEYIHVTDWLPTLLTAAGAEPPSDIDGFNLWDTVIKNTKSKRNELFEFDDLTGFASIIMGDYKLVVGNITVAYSNHQGGNLREVMGKTPSYVDSLQNCATFEVLNAIGKPFDFAKTRLRDELRIVCDQRNNEQEQTNLCYPQEGTSCLFNIKADPCETRDVSDENPVIVQNMLERLRKEMQRVIPRSKVYRDPRSSPRLLNYTWDTWADEII
ncbi:arylsulfatase J-like [Battus philenor]|uniref:arylsulfatase J-like n=1 Tax=Battus philenor TaxID=42288 RepID=UPI0035D03DB0